MNRECTIIAVRDGREFRRTFPTASAAFRQAKTDWRTGDKDIRVVRADGSVVADAQKIEAAVYGE